MKFVKKINRKILILSFLIALPVVYYFLWAPYRGQASNSPLRNKVLSVIKNCKKEGNTLNSMDQKCVYKAFHNFVNRDNVSQVVASLMDIFSKADNSRDLGTNNCHIPAHIAGEIAYQDGADLNELWDKCSNNCTFGCLHGGFQGLFKEQGSALLDNLETACHVLEDPNDADLRSCWHIVGHGLAEYYGADMNSAINKCMGLPNEKQQRHCIMGVRMEFIVASVDNTSPMKPLKDYEYLDFCKKFPSKFIEDCYAEAAYYQIRITDDVNQMVDICKLAPNIGDSKIRCVTGSGSVFFFTNKANADVIHNFCARYGDKHYSNECAIGSVDLASSEWDHLETGTQVCLLASKDFVGECLAFYGGRVQFYNGMAKRKEICGMLSPQDNKRCMGKPTMKRDYLIPVTFETWER